MVEPLATDRAIAKIVATGRRNPPGRQHILVDLPSALHFGVEPRAGSAVKIGMLAEAARHRIVRKIAAAEPDVERMIGERETLPGLVAPRPFARLVQEPQFGARPT